MIGSESMSLLGWKVLAEWSIDHSCLDDEHKKDVRKEWRHRWKSYCKWIVETYGSQFPAENSS
jgi:adenosine deaminase CECR1